MAALVDGCAVGRQVWFDNPMPWDFALILVLMGVVLPWRGAIRVRQLLAGPQLSSSDRLVIYASTIALQWALVALVVWRCMERGLSAEALGVTLPDPQLSALVAAILSIVLLVTQTASVRHLARLPRSKQGFLGEMARKILPQDAVESLGFVGLAVTVALCEEFLYRGFVFALIERITGGSLMGAVVGSAVFFGAGHVYQGKRGVIVVFLIGLLLAGARLWTGSLAAPVVTHLVVDLVAGLMAPRALRAEDMRQASVR